MPRKPGWLIFPHKLAKCEQTNSWSQARTTGHCVAIRENCLVNQPHLFQRLISPDKSGFTNNTCEKNSKVWALAECRGIRQTCIWDCELKPRGKWRTYGLSESAPRQDFPSLITEGEKMIDQDNSYDYAVPVPLIENIFISPLNFLCLWQNLADGSKLWNMINKSSNCVLLLQDCPGYSLSFHFNMYLGISSSTSVRTEVCWDFTWNSMHL